MRTQTIRYAVYGALSFALVASLILFAPDRTHAATQSTGYMQEVGISGQTITNPVIATFLTVPLGTEHAWITVKNNPACWGANENGAAPTATSGGEWPVSFFKLDNDGRLLQNIRVINCAEGATTVKLYYTKRRRL